MKWHSFVLQAEYKLADATGCCIHPTVMRFRERSHFGLLTLAKAHSCRLEVVTWLMEVNVNWKATKQTKTIVAAFDPVASWMIATHGWPVGVFRISFRFGPMADTSDTTMTKDVM